MCAAHPARNMALAKATLVLLALLAGSARVHAGEPSAAPATGGHLHGIQQFDAPAAAPATFHSTTCTLAGGWCPLEQEDGSASGLFTWEKDSHTNASNDSQPVPPRQHKPLLPLNTWDVLGVTVAGLALLLAASGGIGGGAILVPLYLMVLGFSTSGAVALSNITIVGGTLANLVFNVGRRHPLRQGEPLIDWDLILVMEPSTILGALLGGYVNKLLPGWLTTVLLALLLSFITYKMAAKAADIQRKERRALQPTLERLSVVDAEGGDIMETLRTPLLHPLQPPSLLSGHEPAAAGLCRGLHGASPPVLSPVGPLALRPTSAGSSGSGGSDLSDHDGSRSPVGNNSAAFAEAAEAAAADAQQKQLSGQQREPPPSSAVPTDTQCINGGHAAVPLLVPIKQSDGTRLLLRPKNEGQQPLLAQEPSTPTTPHSNDLKPEAAGGRLAADAPKTAIAASRSGHAKGAERGWELHLPWSKVAVLVLLLAGVVGADILKHHARCPSLSYWVRATAMVPATAIALLAVRAYLVQKGKAHRESGYELLEGDVEWTPTTTLIYPALCSFAGICAGTFGVGGGIIKGPLMLEMGVLPEVAAATSATMILFTSVSASVVFISFGAVQWDYAAVLFVLGVGCTAAGQLLVMWVNRHIQSRSLLVIIMTSVLAMSTVALSVQGVQATVVAARAHELWRFHSICGASSH